MATHPPTRFGKVLLELLRNCGMDVPLALLPSDPAVLEGIAENQKFDESESEQMKSEREKMAREMY